MELYIFSIHISLRESLDFKKENIIFVNHNVMLYSFYTHFKVILKLLFDFFGLTHMQAHIHI